MTGAIAVAVTLRLTQCIQYRVYAKPCRVYSRSVRPREIDIMIRVRRDVVDLLPRTRFIQRSLDGMEGSRRFVIPAPH